jgi:hypothetical protein
MVARRWLFAHDASQLDCFSRLSRMETATWNAGSIKAFSSAQMCGVQENSNSQGQADRPWPQSLWIH